jgi:hypothetical protein
VVPPCGRNGSIVASSSRRNYMCLLVPLLNAHRKEISDHLIETLSQRNLRTALHL